MEDLWEYHAKWVTVAGRRYLLMPLTVKAKKAGAKGRTYTQYYISLPKRLALELLGDRLPQPGSEGVPITVLAAKAPWYHLLDWSTLPTEDLPTRIKKEIRALTLDSPQKPLVLVPARPEQLRELGLDPEKPITLEDLVEKVEEKIRRELAAKSTASSRL
ncbi:MAG: hypothetical protein F7C35_03720 [Desulfurococcales archaeon]|nr:hypothetical protein [Desulfurococcales archaeon]